MTDTSPNSAGPHKEDENTAPEVPPRRQTGRRSRRRADREYPIEVDRSWTGKGIAVAVMTIWIEASYQHLESLPQLPTFLMNTWSSYVPYKQVREDSDAWKHLRSVTSLLAWIYVASHEPTIAQHFGTSEQLFDAAYFGLEREAFIFLN